MEAGLGVVEQQPTVSDADSDYDVRPRPVER